MNKVWQILKSKGDQVWTISPKSSVLKALDSMVEHQIGSLIVTEGDEVVGLFTDRDLAYQLGPQQRLPEEIQVSEMMNDKVVTVSPTQSVKECMNLMTDKRVRHLIVMEQGRLVGIISIGDVVKDMIEELEFMVDQLENYIKGLA